MLLAIANQPIAGNTTFTTGGDVSRFQRRSMPRPAQSVQAAQNGGNAAVAVPASGANAQGAAGPVVPAGPVVRVARGNNVTYVPVGAR